MSLRIILITGANGGLGQAIARAFLEESQENFVWLGVRSARSRAETLAAGFPQRAQLVTLEVTEPESWSAAINAILSGHGRIDVLVNNAGHHADALLATLRAEQWHDVISANLDGAFHGCQAVLPTMISQRSGRIINVSSLSALLAPPGQANYAAAKAGLLAMTQSLAKEVARLNITVNAVCPGYVETEALSAMTEQDRKTAQARIPMRRFGKPEEIAAVIRFLACPDASYVTGSTVKIDGGIL